VRKFTFQHLLSFILISIGLMTTMTFGFVPFINIFEEYGYTTFYLPIFWIPYGVSCIIFGFIIDKIKNKNIFCFSYVFWGITIIGLIYAIPNLTLILIFVIISAIFAAINTITAVSYVSSHIQINRRGFYTSIYLGIGWAFVGGTAYLSYINVISNLIFLAALNIGVGIISFLIFYGKKMKLDLNQKIIIPRTYNIRRNGIIFYFSTFIFGAFLGIIVYLLGTVGNFDAKTASIYLKNIQFYYQVVAMFGFGTNLVNFDFLVIGVITAIISPIIGKLMDKIGRKSIFFAANLAIPTILILFSFWTNIVLLVVSIFFYALVVTVFVIINCNVWSDLAPDDKIARYNGYGWSSLGLGGAGGFFLGIFITTPSNIANIDILVLIAILIMSELSLIPFVLMKESLPPAEEIEWRNEIINLYVISSSGIIMSDYSFKQEVSSDSDLLAGGITGIVTILKEIIGSLKDLKSIDHEEDLNILRTKLKKLTSQIHEVFWEILDDWNGNIEILTPIKTMIRNIFEQ